MKTFNNLKIGAKILIGIILVSLVSVFVGYNGYSSMKNMNETQSEIAEVRLPSVEALLIISEAQTATLAGERGLLNDQWMEADIRKSQYDYIDSAFKRAEEGWGIYTPLPQTEEESQVWKRFIPEWEQWKTDQQAVINLSKEKDKLIASGVAIDGLEMKQLDERISAKSLQSRNSFLKT